MRYIINLFVFVTFIVSIVFLLVKNKESTRLISENHILNDNNVNNIALLKNVQEYQLLSYKYDNLKIANVLLSDYEGNKIQLQNLIKDSTTVFNFSSTNCSECFHAILEIIKNIDSKRLIVIFNTDNLRAFKYFVNNNNINVKAYSVDLTYKIFPSEIENLPCFFSVDNNLLVTHTLFPIKNDVNFTNKYLEFVLHR